MISDDEREALRVAGLESWRIAMRARGAALQVRATEAHEEAVTTVERANQAA